MPPLNVLIKPASSACNMNCRYCFYRDVSSKRENAFEGMLSYENTEEIIKKAMDFAETSCSFMFQGGEPTLAGLDYFKNVISIEKKYSRPGVKVYNSIQTNGFDISEEFAAFLAENGFLVGLSLDGPAEIHNLNRISASGDGTFTKVLKTANLFDKKGVDYNILCVLTGRSAKSAEKIFNFFKKNKFGYIQFIPCLEPLGAAKGSEKYYLSPEAYGDFLVKIFRLWFGELKKGNYISIRHIDNYLNILLGGKPEACSMNGRCSIQFVCEGSGNVYPCDFYVLDELCLGNIHTNDFKELAENENAIRFLKESLPVPDECRKCFYYSLCRNGCKRDRNSEGKNYYCSSYKYFFENCIDEMKAAASIIITMQNQ